ncbi:phosphoglycerate mutase-like protein 4 isoform X2 [Hevea brasiliensis]|uniref:phosphoglycerate mutase-like protein 4 isoform X2 n=1 Tax=Hevea brasiliensis TaxID=3981 RepID=UPI0025EA8FFE|nr:phosphoglycerate mutase-like protein 4 isoform X2 [Hevea brasiliensis]
MAESPSISGSNFRSVDRAYTEIVVVRHGETEWNAVGRIQVAARLSREPKISAVYSSDLKRALETAETIAACCGGLEVIKDANLWERHLGDLQGLVLREAAKVSPNAYQAFLSHRTNQVIPGGGESLDQLYQRSTSALQRIARKHRGERVVVVTHGGVIRALYRRACPNNKPAGKVLNTSINVFHLFDGDKWTVKIWGDVSHLDETEYLASGFGGDRTSG